MYNIFIHYSIFHAHGCCDIRFAQSPYIDASTPGFTLSHCFAYIDTCMKLCHGSSVIKKSWRNIYISEHANIFSQQCITSKTHYALLILFR